MRMMRTRPCGSVSADRAKTAEASRFTASSRPSALPITNATSWARSRQPAEPRGQLARGPCGAALVHGDDGVSGAGGANARRFGGEPLRGRLARNRVPPVSAERVPLRIRVAAAWRTRHIRPPPTRTSGGRARRCVASRKGSPQCCARHSFAPRNRQARVRRLSRDASRLRPARALRGCSRRERPAA